MEYLVSYTIVIQWLMAYIGVGLGAGIFCAGLMVHPKTGFRIRVFCSWVISLAGGSLFWFALFMIIWPID